MQTATFYIIEPDSPQATSQGFHDYALFLSLHFARQGAKVYVNCHDKNHANEIADVFWQMNAHDFMPHNLVGEGPRNGTAIEIGHSALKPSWNRQLIINLAKDETTFAQQFTEVIDFVPCDEKAKQLARKRYKVY